MIEVSIVLLLLVISGAFSGTEVAFTSLTVDQLEEMKRQNGSRGRLVARLYDELDLVLTSITIGNNLANLAASALVSAVTIRLFGETWLLASTAVLTFLVLIIGEVTPKQIGILHNRAVTQRLSPFLRVFAHVFAPFIWVIRTISNALTRLSGGTARPRVTAEGLLHLARYAGSTGVLNQLHASIVKNVIRSHDVRVQAVMTHRTRIVSLEKRATVGASLATMLESGYSRFPVYDDDPETIVGIVLLREAARAHLEGETDAPLSRLMVPPPFVPENRTLQEVLTMLQRSHANMAIVLDEYGGLAGLVTVEDLVEEFVGELYDENEPEESHAIVAISEREFRIIGDTPLHVVIDNLEIQLPEVEEAQTIGGFLTEQFGHIPAVGETVAIKPGTFTVEAVERSRILTVRFRRREEAAE